MVYILHIVEKQRPDNILQILGVFDEENQAKDILLRYSEENDIKVGAELIIKEYQCEKSDKYYVHHTFMNSMGYYDFNILNIYPDLLLVPKHRKRSKFTSFRACGFKANEIYNEKKSGKLWMENYV